MRDIGVCRYLSYPHPLAVFRRSDAIQLLEHPAEVLRISEADDTPYFQYCAHAACCQVLRTRINDFQ